MKRILFALMLAVAPVAVMADPPPINVTTNTQAFTNLGTPVQIGAGAKTLQTFLVNNTQASATAYIQFFNASSTPTLGTAVVWQGLCPAAALCFIPLPQGGLFFPTGAWVGSASAINGSSASSSGVQAYAAWPF